MPPYVDTCREVGDVFGLASGCGEVPHRSTEVALQERDESVGQQQFT